MKPPSIIRSRTRRMDLAFAALSLAALILIGWFLGEPSGITSTTFKSTATAETRRGPPWIYGTAQARFTVIEYGDLECPYCKAHFPLMRQWIDGQGNVNWQWHHLPLPGHEPAASTSAEFAECAGEADGSAAFWDSLGWIYEHTQGDGRGLSVQKAFPGLTPAMKACIADRHARAYVRSQVDQAAREGVSATPTLKVRDNRTGRSLLITGPVSGDGLLSAMDMLAKPENASAVQAPKSNMPADTPVSDMPR